MEFNLRYNYRHVYEFLTVILISALYVYTASIEYSFKWKLHHSETHWKRRLTSVDIEGANPLGTALMTTCRSDHGRVQQACGSFGLVICSRREVVVEKL